MISEQSSGGIRIRLDLAYDGGDFAGWALQPGLRTIQGELEVALEQIFRRPTRVTVAGRTDAGVHATSQVVHFDVEPQIWEALPGRSSRSPARSLIDRLGGLLPKDIVVRSAMIAPPGFDARFSAGSRRYVYRIDDGTAANLFRRGYVLRHRGELDVIAMDDAARQLVGLQDFAAYCKPREGATTIRRLITFAWRRPTIGPDAGLVTGIIRSDAFCHNMVRSLVGSIIKVGEGRWLVDRPREILASGDRALAAAVVAAHGLTLEEVSYPPPPFDAERATQIRAMRE